MRVACGRDGPVLTAGRDPIMCARTSNETPRRRFANQRAPTPIFALDTMPVFASPGGTWTDPAPAKDDATEVTLARPTPALR